jgi:hypothetical protein
VDGAADPEMINRLGFLEINKLVQHYHLNTVLGNEVLHYLGNSGTALSSEFLAKLMCHYGMRDRHE